MNRYGTVWGAAAGENGTQHALPKSILGVVQVNAELTLNTVFCFCARNVNVSVRANPVASERFPLRFHFRNNRTFLL